MPLLADYEQFSSNDHMKEVLGMMYIDILEFHREALRYFKLKCAESRRWQRRSHGLTFTISLETGLLGNVAGFLLQDQAFGE